MTANEIAQMVRTEPYHTNLNRNVIAEFIDQQADRIAELQGEVSHLKHINKNWAISEGLALQKIAELEKLLEHSIGSDCREMRYIQEIENKDAKIAELEFENKAFRKELFNIGSMRSCSYAAQHHGFVSPRQAGDDAREYIAEILEKAKTKECE